MSATPLPYVKPEEERFSSGVGHIWTELGEAIMRTSEAAKRLRRAGTTDERRLAVAALEEACRKEAVADEALRRVMGASRDE